MRPSAVTSLRNGCLAKASAPALKCPTLEVCFKDKLWLRPLGKAIVIFNMVSKLKGLLDSEDILSQTAARSPHDHESSHFFTYRT